MAASVPVLGRSVAGATHVELEAGDARWRADLDTSAGGAGRDPTPHQLLDSALAACTILTIQLYARRKQYPVGDVQVRIEHDESGGTYRMQRQLTIGGELSDAQRTDLLRVANACPIHKALHARFEIETALTPP